MRNRLLEGEEKVDAATKATAEYFPTVLTAGLIVAAGSAALVAGTLDFFQALGPAMAGTVIISLLVAVTLVPASWVCSGASSSGRASTVFRHAGRTDAGSPHGVLRSAHARSVVQAGGIRRDAHLSRRPRARRPRAG